MAAGWRNALAALAVLGALIGLIAVPYAVSEALPAEGPLPPGDRLDVGYGVTLKAPAGARLALENSRPGAGEVELRVAGTTIELTAVEVRGSAAAYAAHNRTKLSRDDGWRVGPRESARTAAGVSGERGTLTPTGSDGRQGCYATFAAELSGVLVVVRPVDGCAAVPPEIWSSITSLTIEPAQPW